MRWSLHNVTPKKEEEEEDIGRPENANLGISSVVCCYRAVLVAKKVDDDGRLY